MLSSNTHTIAQFLNTQADKNIAFKGVFTDTRTPVRGGLFVALMGANFDGHDYIKQAEENHAVAIVASKKINTDLPVIYMDDTVIALGKIAQFHRKKNQVKVVAITGSNGKTTTKNMLANILSLNAPTLKTQGNLNNHLGVPMTLLELAKKHQYAVIEMGANHLGEIAHLREITCPDVALVTNTLDAHIGEFGGFENLVKAKGEIYSPHSKNIVHTNTRFKGDINFGKNGDVFASNVNNNRFTLNINDERIAIDLQLLGEHNIENALAASACAYALDIDIKTIKQGLENTKPEKGRLNLIHQKGLTIIDDSYNAGPTSTKIALKILAKFEGKTIAILGSMAELGDKSDEMHFDVGCYAKTLGITDLYSIGENAKGYNFQHFDNTQDLLEKIKALNKATLLFKGSRVAKLDQIIKKLCV